MSAFPANMSGRYGQPHRLLAQGVLSTVDAPIYTCPSDRTAIVTHIVVCNSDTQARTFRLHHCLPGDASAVKNAQFYDARLGVSVSIVDDTQRPMLPNESIRAKASAASVVSISVYGTEAIA